MKKILVLATIITAITAFSAPQVTYTVATNIASRAVTNNVAPWALKGQPIPSAMKTNDVRAIVNTSVAGTNTLLHTGDVPSWSMSMTPQEEEVFSNAVLSVGLNIDTNSVAVLNELAATFGGFPIEGTATTVGGLLAALAAAIAWLKRNKRGMDDLSYGTDGDTIALKSDVAVLITSDLTDPDKAARANAVGDAIADIEEEYRQKTDLIYGEPVRKTGVKITVNVGVIDDAIMVDAPIFKLSHNQESIYLPFAKKEGTGQSAKFIWGDESDNFVELSSGGISSTVMKVNIYGIEGQTYVYSGTDISTLTFSYMGLSFTVETYSTDTLALSSQIGNQRKLSDLSYHAIGKWAIDQQSQYGLIPTGDYILDRATNRYVRETDTTYYIILADETTAKWRLMYQFNVSSTPSIVAEWFGDSQQTITHIGATDTARVTATYLTDVLVLKNDIAPSYDTYLNPSSPHTATDNSRIVFGSTSSITGLVIKLDGNNGEILFDGFGSRLKFAVELPTNAVVSWLTIDESYGGHSRLVSTQCPFGGSDGIDGSVYSAFKLSWKKLASNTYELRFLAMER